MPRSAARHRLEPLRLRGFTLIELLVVISIIALLISILLPSLGRAREQAKSVHCLARLREYGTAIASYMNANDGIIPAAQWHPSPGDLKSPDGSPIGEVPPEKQLSYGWMELLFAFVYRDEVNVPDDYPVQRNIAARRWQEYFSCKQVGDDLGRSSGHYRVYLPAWAHQSVTLAPGRRYGEDTAASPYRASPLESIPLRMPIIGDANEYSERGDGEGVDDCSYIDAGEANFAGSDGRSNGNRFSDRHYGGTNYLFPDLHAKWSTSLRDDLARDFDLNGVEDVLSEP